jgi:hypothetical protein
MDAARLVTGGVWRVGFAIFCKAHDDKPERTATLLAHSYEVMNAPINTFDLSEDLQSFISDQI